MPCFNYWVQPVNSDWERVFALGLAGGEGLRLFFGQASSVGVPA
jgi:hypothetical protein